MGWDVSIRAAWIGGILTIIATVIGALMTAEHWWPWLKGIVVAQRTEQSSPAGEITPAAIVTPKDEPQRPAKPTTIEYSKPSGTRGTQTVYSVKCVDGPADGRWHPLLVDPAEMLRIGSPFVWVYDAQDHLSLPEVDEAALKRLREEPGRAQRGSTVYGSVVSHESKMEATGRNRYSLEQSRDGDFLLRYAGAPAAPPLTFPPKVEEPANVLKIDTTQGNVTTQRVYPLNCVGGPNDSKSFPSLTDPQMLLDIGRSIVWVDVLSPCPAPGRHTFGDNTRSSKAKLVELSLYELVVSKDTINLEHRGDVRSVDYLRATRPVEPLK